MDWKIRLASATLDDLEVIADHLFRAHRDLGEDIPGAGQRAVRRVERIHANTLRIATAPFRGMRHEDLLPGLRSLTIERAVYWFRIDEPAGEVAILAIFGSAQDHPRHMARRLGLERWDPAPARSGTGGARPQFCSQRLRLRP